MSRPTNAAICSFVKRVRGCLYKKTSRSRSQPFRMAETRASSGLTSSSCWRLFDVVEMSRSPSRSVKETRFSNRHHRDRGPAASEPYEIRLYTLVGYEDRVIVETSGNRTEKPSDFAKRCKGESHFHPAGCPTHPAGSTLSSGHSYSLLPIA
jgi:hypothetical protein